VRLFELYESDFEQDDPLRVATTAALSDIKSDIEDNAFKGKFTVGALLKQLSARGINIDHEQLIELVEEEPWCNFIANIKGDKVIFKGDPGDDYEAMDPDKTTGTLDKMADRSTKKHSDELK
jgi:hypothetical protein